MADGPKRIPVSRERAAQAKQAVNGKAPQRILCSSNMPQRVPTQKPLVPSQKQQTTQPTNQTQPKPTAPVQHPGRALGATENKDPALTSTSMGKRSPTGKIICDTFTVRGVHWMSFG